VTTEGRGWREATATNAVRANLREWDAGSIFLTLIAKNETRRLLPNQ